MSLTKQDLFERSPVMRAIIRLAFPTVIGQIILVIYNMADTFFISLTRSDAMITSATVCMPAFMFLSAISNLFGVGGACVISRAMGKGDLDRAGNASVFSVWGCLIVTALYSLGALLFLDPFVNILGGSAEDVHLYARAYLLVTVVIGGLFTAANMLFSHLIRSEGRSIHASVGVILGGVLNMALDPLFMFVILPEGHEVLGAAIATTLSNAVALGYYARVLIKYGRDTVLRFRPTRAALCDAIPADVISTGLPACLMTLCENISYAVLDNLMSSFGTIMQAGLGVAKKVNMLAHCIVRGMSQGVLPLIAYSYSNGNRRRMKQVILDTCLLSVGMAAMCMAACLLFSSPLIGLFIRPEQASHGYGVKFLRILCVGAPFSACAYTFISFFQAVGDGRKSFILAILRKGILDIPMMFILNTLIAVYGILWATPVADIVCCIVSLILFTGFIRRHGL